MPPPVTVRTAPSGVKMKKGHKCTIAFALNAGIAFWEIDPVPPGLDAGTMINTTTQHNVRWRSKAVPDLIDATPMTCTVAYDPRVRVQISSILGVPGGITVAYPNGDTDSWWGVLKSFKPGALVVDGMPTAAIEIELTNEDPATGLEDGPAFAELAGTTI